MYRHGLAYRLHLPDGKKLSLGRDLDSALMRYQLAIGGSPSGEFAEPKAIADMLKRHAKGAKQRKLSFSIDASHVLAAMESQRNRCAVTGLEFRGDKPPGSRIRPWLPSIDRVNSRDGYEPGNIRVVCAFVNVALNAFGDGCFAQIMEPLIEAEVQRRLASTEAAHPLENEMSDGMCRKCGGAMKSSKAIGQTYSGQPDFPGDTTAVTISPAGPGSLIDCVKCSVCGWSVTAPPTPQEPK